VRPPSTAGLATSCPAARGRCPDIVDDYALARCRRRLALSLALRLFERIRMLDLTRCFIFASDLGQCPAAR
jgi:hypothetical protein